MAKMSDSWIFRIYIRSLRRIVTNTSRPIRIDFNPERTYL